MANEKKEQDKFQSTIFVYLLLLWRMYCHAHAVTDRLSFLRVACFISTEIQESLGHFKLRKLHALVRWSSKEECTVTVS